MQMLLTAVELAGLLKISIRQLWRLRDSGSIPAPMTIGGRGRTIRWSADAISKWVEAGVPNVRRTGWTPRDQEGRK